MGVVKTTLRGESIPLVLRKMAVQTDHHDGNRQAPEDAEPDIDILQDIVAVRLEYSGPEFLYLGLESIWHIVGPDSVSA